jgi:uncharacterized protein YecT (DUF1311 family)
MHYLPPALLAICLASPAVRAEDYCDSANQGDMNMCAGRKFEEANKAMNVRYATLMKRIDPEAQTKLRQAQKAWMSYRQKICLFETSGLGSVRPTIFAGCLTNQTNDHVKYLDYQLTCEEGDLSCQGRDTNKN